MKIPANLKKALADLAPLPRACLLLLATSGLTPLTGKEIHQLVSILDFLLLPTRTRDTLSKLARDGHIIELRCDHQPRRYRIVSKYIAAPRNTP